MLGFGAGAIVAAAVLGRVPVRHKEEVSVVAWVGYSLCFLVFAAAGNLVPADRRRCCRRRREAVARILLVSAMQEQIPSAVLGRAMAVFFTVHRATHGLGLVTVAFLVTSLPISEALLIGAGLELGARSRLPWLATGESGSGARSRRVAPATVTQAGVTVRPTW